MTAKVTARQSAPGAEQTPRVRIWHRFVRWDIASVVVALAVIAGILVIFVPAFRSAYNLYALGFTISVTAIVGLAQVSVLSVGQFNLALTAIGAIVGILAGWMIQNLGVPWPIALVAAIAFGCLAGGLQGLIIVVTGINPFIVSLALAAAYFGAMLGLTRGASFNRLPPEYVGIGRLYVLGVPVLLIICLVVAVAVAVLFHRTALGRQMLATGANPRTAMMSGVPTRRIILFAHVLSAALAGLAAVMLVARLGSAQPSLGAEWLLPSFAAPVLGGTLLTGGKISVAGTVLGALLLAVIANGLVLFGVSAYWYQTLLGIVLLAALAVDRSRQTYVLRHQL